MFDLRRLIRFPENGAPVTPGRLALLAAAPAGLALGALVWVVVGGSSAAEARIGGLEARLGGTVLAAPGPPSSEGWVAQAGSHPLFALTTGPGAVAEAVVKLEGLARTARESSALLSINGAAAQWLQRGASKDGVTLMEVGSSNAVLMTALGRREVVLGTGPAANSSGEPPAQPPTSGGFHMPPPPASAPQGAQP